jgi:hypothetical protein
MEKVHDAARAYGCPVVDNSDHGKCNIGSLAACALVSN